ncbi:MULTISPECIES: hypothetical protein [unclassified Spirillospora]|uniref:hypothetical protein n=1 Tax=unclassified Spirillospora TaxID=2642701 RepID=UPI0037249B6E
MLTAGREGHTMRPHSRNHHRLTSTAIFAAALLAPAFIALPAQADECKSGNPFDCKYFERGSGSGGQGGSSGGGSSGPVEPPDPVGLTENEDVGFVPIDGDPAPAAPTTLDWVAAAESSARLPAPIVHTAPNGKTYVRMRTSLWVDGFEVVRTDPIGGGGQSIQATANPVSVTWNMGEAQKKCEDAGSKEGKSCNYTYKRSSAGQPAGAYQITATITWDLTWTCEGAACDAPGGDLGPESVTSQPTPLVVSEIQTNTGQ